MTPTPARIERRESLEAEVKQKAYRKNITISEPKRKTDVRPVEIEKSLS